MNGPGNDAENDDDSDPQGEGLDGQAMMSHNLVFDPMHFQAGRSSSRRRHHHRRDHHMGEVVDLLQGARGGFNPAMMGEGMLNIERIVSSIIPNGQISSASFARMDGNTGAITLSVQRRPGGSMGANRRPLMSSRGE